MFRLRGGSCFPRSSSVSAGYAEVRPCRSQVIGGDGLPSIRTAIKFLAVRRVTARA